MQKFAQKILKKLGYRNFSVTLHIVSPTEIRRLNKMYRRKNKATDVLSFPIFEKPIKNAKTLRLLGDIVVNRVDARDKNRLRFLVIHGLLHIIGYNHDSRTDGKKWDKLSHYCVFDSKNHFYNKDPLILVLIQSQRYCK